MVVVNVYRATVEWTWAEAASTVIASAPGLITTVAIVGAIVLVIAVALVAASLLMADQLTVVQRTKAIAVVSNSNTSNKQSQKDNSPGNG